MGIKYANTYEEKIGKLAFRLIFTAFCNCDSITRENSKFTHANLYIEWNNNDYNQFSFNNNCVHWAEAVNGYSL